MASAKKHKIDSASSDDLKAMEVQMSGPNMAAVLLKQDELLLKEVPMPPKPLPHQVLVAMKCVGICGSDVHYWTHGCIGDFIVKAPMVLGHESAGVVVAIGDDVFHLNVGDRVALEPGIPCRACQICKSGRYNLCDKMRFFATPPIDGSLANFVVHDADMCFKLPDNVTLEEGAMCEPLSVGVAACRKANVQPGSTVLIMGAGPIGVICMLVAKAFGATHVYITDVMDDRLAMATKLGAAGAFNARRPEAELVEAIKRQGGHLDCAIECSGHESATRVALQCVKSGGTLCLVGLHQFEQKLPIFQVAVREVDIKGIFRYCNTYPTCISLLASGAVNVQPLITHRYRISNSANDLLRGFTHAKTMADGALKIMFHLGDGTEHTARS